MNALATWFQGRLPPVPADPDEHAQQVRLTQSLTGTLTVLALAVWIAMAEVDRLIADAATATGRSASASSLQAIDPRLGQENWSLWVSLPEEIGHQVMVLLAIYFILDMVFAALYAWLLFRLFAGRRAATWIVRAVLFSELAEGMIQLITLGQLHTEPLRIEFLLTMAFVMTEIKWLALVSLIVGIFVYQTLRMSFFGSVRRAWNALFFHRLSVAVIVVIGSLALLPIPGVNDQMPDTQRAWLDSGPGRFAITSIAALVVSLGLFYLGRRRSELAWALYFSAPEVPSQTPKYWMWIVPPALLGLAIAFVSATTGLVVPLGWQTVVAAGVPLAVSGLSWLLAKSTGSESLQAPRPSEPARALDAWRCGDVLAFVLLAVSGMALVRAFTAPMALGAAGALDFDASAWASAGYLGLGFATVGLAFPAGALLVRFLWGGFLDPRGAAGLATHTVTVILMIAFTCMGLVFAVNPATVSNVAGVPGTAVLTMGAWAMVIGLSVVVLQRQRPLELFKRMGLRANPVLTLIAAVLAVGSLSGGNPALHHVRELGGSQAAAPDLTTRPSVEAAFESWLARSGDCSLEVPPNGGADETAALRVRPLILVAAEGGGIRAASWTVRALEELSLAGDCGKTSVMASSGVSGGSLGLTLSHLYGPEDAVEKMKKLAEPGALAAAVAGALVGDIVGSGTGLMIPTQFTAEDGSLTPPAWNDRAGLVESVWEQSAGKLADPFDAEIAGPAGALLLNSTDTGSGCRVVVSQLDLPDMGGTTPDAPAHGVQCTAGQGFPVSMDLFDQQAQCTLRLRWSTATMLSARFPIISPAGRAPAVVTDANGDTECQTRSGFQLIDGGYSEGSGLGTISDLWPAVQAEVLNHNACVPAVAALPAGGELPENHPCANMDAENEIVIPVFLYLQNSPGADIVTRPPQAAGELAVPLAGLKARELQIASAAWIQRLEAGANVCPGTAADNACMMATAEVRKALGNRSVVVVAPNSVPALAAPLGWSLSNISQQQLEKAMDEEALVTEAEAGMQPFARLLAYLGG